jgi:hypothetical protein
MYFHLIDAVTEEGKEVKAETAPQKEPTVGPVLGVRWLLMIQPRG